MITGSGRGSTIRTLGCAGDAGHHDGRRGAAAQPQLARNASGSMAEPRFLMVSTPMSRSRNSERSRLSPNGSDVDAPRYPSRRANPLRGRR